MFFDPLKSVILLVMDSKKFRKTKKEAETLAGMVEIYCRRHHPDRNRPAYSPPGKLSLLLEAGTVNPCPDCRKLLSYGLSMRLICPLDPKPRSKKCPTPCYRDSYRQKIREVMRFSGWQMVRRGRIDLIRKMWW